MIVRAPSRCQPQALLAAIRAVSRKRASQSTSFKMPSPARWEIFLGMRASCCWQRRQPWLAWRLSWLEAGRCSVANWEVVLPDLPRDSHDCHAMLR